MRTVMGLILVIIVVLILAFMLGWSWYSPLVVGEFTHGILVVSVPEGTDKIVLRDVHATPPDAIYWTSMTDRKNLEIAFVPRVDSVEKPVREEVGPPTRHSTIRKKDGEPTAQSAPEIFVTLDADVLLQRIDGLLQSWHKQCRSDLAHEHANATIQESIADLSGQMKKANDSMQESVVATHGLALEVKNLAANPPNVVIDLAGLQRAAENSAAELKKLVIAQSASSMLEELRKMVSGIEDMTAALRGKVQEPGLTVKAMRPVHTHPDVVGRVIPEDAIDAVVVHTSSGAFMFKKVHDVIYVAHEYAWHPLRVVDSVLLLDHNGTFRAVGFLEEIMPYLP